MAKFSTDGKYMKWQELPEHDVNYTIDHVEQEILEKDGDKEKKWVVYFTEAEKGFPLNATNGKTLCKLFGDEMDDWAGKRVTLYVKDDVQFGSDVVSAIRIRTKASA